MPACKMPKRHHLLFIYGLLYDAVCSSDYTVSNDGIFGKCMEEAVAASFNVLSRNLPGGGEENHGTPQDS
jgi:hypothetical protein